MILIARNPPLQDSTDGDDGQRHLNIVKNKINGIHRIIHAEFDYSTGVYFS